MTKLSSKSVLDILSLKPLDQVEAKLDRAEEIIHELCDNYMMHIWSFEEDLTEWEYEFATNIQARFSKGNYRLTSAQFDSLENMGKKYMEKREKLNNDKRRFR